MDEEREAKGSPMDIGPIPTYCTDQPVLLHVDRRIRIRYCLLRSVSTRPRRHSAARSMRPWSEKRETKVPPLTQGRAAATTTFRGTVVLSGVVSEER